MSSNQHTLEDRILRMAATDNSDLPDFPDDKSDLSSDFEYDPEEYEEMEVVEEISENELLKFLDQQESALSVAQRLFYHELNTTEYQSHSDSWDLQCLTPKAIEELYGNGWTELEGLVDLDVLRGAHNEAEGLLDQHAFISAKDYQKESDPYRDAAARDDAIAWMDPKNELTGPGTVDTPPYLNKVIEFISGPLYHDLSKMIRLQGRNEYQLSYYHAEGAHYERHRDAFPTDNAQDVDQRRVTVILYLNPGWDTHDGGEVKIFGRTDDHGLPEGADRIIKPQLGRIALFLSGVVDYEVLPTNHKENYALTAWLR